MRISYVLVVAALAVAGCGTRTAGAAGSPPAPPRHTVQATPIPPLDSERAAPARSRCPRSGLRLTAEPANAAMGLRAQTLILTNCGKRVRQVSGYPKVRLLDTAGDPLKVRLDRGAQEITTAVADPGPETVTLRPGRSAHFSLAWRNTYTDTSRRSEVGATTGATVVVTAAGTRLTVDTPVDLGSTGVLGVTAWTSPKGG
ncbi:DUF4232 domain-containing protein [Nonomuraea sp. NPDC003214]